METAFQHLFLSTTLLMFVTRFCSDEEKTRFVLLDWTFLNVIEKAKDRVVLLQAYLLEWFLMRWLCRI